jgi:hypothetical protein
MLVTGTPLMSKRRYGSPSRSIASYGMILTCAALRYRRRDQLGLSTHHGNTAWAKGPKLGIFE